MNNCPNCKASLIGDPIPEEDCECFGGATHFKREVGLELPELYDGTIAYQCPDCKYIWSSARCFDEHLEEVKKVFGSKKEGGEDE